MKIDIEWMGWIKCKWSGFRILIDSEAERMPNGYHYAPAYIVCGWWVYQLRIWVILDKPDCRQWWHYPIEMPITAEGQGPAKVGVDAAAMTYEVWDKLLNSHASFDNLPDAINDAMRRNYNGM